MTDFPTISKSDYVILAEFRYALRQYIQFSKQMVEKAGITMQQHQIRACLQSQYCFDPSYFNMLPVTSNLTDPEGQSAITVRARSAAALVHSTPTPNEQNPCSSGGET